MSLFRSKSSSEKLLTIAGGMAVSAIGLVLVPIVMDALDKLADAVNAHQDLLDFEEYDELEGDDIPEFEE